MTRSVEFAETDLAGIMHFTNFYRWMEVCEHEFLRSIGLSVDLPVKVTNFVSMYILAVLLELDAETLVG